MKQKRVIVSILMSLSVLLVLASGAFTAPKTAASNRSKLAGNMYSAGLPILKQKKTYRIAVTKDPDSQNTFAQKPCVIETEKLTNVHIEWIDIPFASWTEKVNVMLASGNLPDAFTGKDVDIMQNIDLFTPLKKDIERYCPNITEMLTKDVRIKKAVTAPNKEIYCLPTDYDNPSATVGATLWINGDWLNKLGKKVPETTDEYLDVLRAFKNGDPNGNGKADEIPFTGRQTDRTNQSIDPLFGAFGAMDPFEYVYSLDGEKVIFGGIQPGYYEGLKWMHKLYAEGLMDMEFFTHTNSQVNAKAANPDLIIGSIMFYIPDSMDERFTNYIPLPPLKGPKGDQLWIQKKLPVGNLQGFSITKQCKEPAVLLRYYDTLMSNLDMVMLWKWGPEHNGGWERVGKDQWTQTAKYVPEGMNLTQFKRTVAGGLYSPLFLWKKWVDLEVPDRRNQIKRDASAVAQKYAVKVMPFRLYDPKKVNARNALFVDIDNYMQRFKATSIVNGIDDAQWKEHLKKCKQLKVDQYTAMWQEYYSYAR